MDSKCEEVLWLLVVTWRVRVANGGLLRHPFSAFFPLLCVFAPIMFASDKTIHRRPTMYHTATNTAV